MYFIHQGVQIDYFIMYIFEYLKHFTFSLLFSKCWCNFSLILVYANKYDLFRLFQKSPLN